MDFEFTSEQNMLRDTVRRFMNDKVKPHAREWDATETFPAEVVRELGALPTGDGLVAEQAGALRHEQADRLLRDQVYCRTGLHQAIALCASGYPPNRPD